MVWFRSSKRKKRRFDRLKERVFKILVLIVEDDPIVADTLSMILEEAGPFKTTANTIETVPSELKHIRVIAILLNLNLPDGDGT
jgi:DNA-binding response OmpR family regulator